LFPERRQKAEPRPLPLALERRDLQVIDGENRLAEAPMADHSAEPVRVHAGVNHGLQLARLI